MAAVAPNRSAMSGTVSRPSTVSCAEYQPQVDATGVEPEQLDRDGAWRGQQRLVVEAIQLDAGRDHLGRADRRLTRAGAAWTAGRQAAAIATARGRRSRPGRASDLRRAGRGGSMRCAHLPQHAGRGRRPNPTAARSLFSSKPRTTMSSTIVTGIVIRPSATISLNASVSASTFFTVKSSPFP